MAFSRFFLFLFLLFTVGVSAQQEATEVAFMEAKLLPASLSPTEELGSARGMKLDVNAFGDLKAEAPQRFTWSVPFPNGTVKTMRFKRFENLSEQLEVAVTDASGFHVEGIQPSLMTYALEGGDARGTLI